MKLHHVSPRPNSVIVVEGIGAVQFKHRYDDGSVLVVARGKVCKLDGERHWRYSK